MIKRLLPHLFILTALAIFGSGCRNASMDTSTAPLRHIVLFKFKDDAAASQIKAIEDAFRALPSKVPEIIDFEWGTDVSVEGKEQDFTHCFFVSFADDAGRAAYLPHPEHKAFVDLLKPSLDKVCVVDYVAEQTTAPLSNAQGTLRHVVLFQWKEGTTPGQVKTIEEAFAGLPSKIPEIKAFEWGINNSPEGLNNGLSHAFFVTFDDAAGRDVYIPHPDHKVFGSVVRPSVEQVLVFDYVASE